MLDLPWRTCCVIAESSCSLLEAVEHFTTGQRSAKFHICILYSLLDITDFMQSLLKY